MPIYDINAVDLIFDSGLQMKLLFLSPVRHFSEWKLTRSACVEKLQAWRLQPTRNTLSNCRFERNSEKLSNPFRGEISKNEPDLACALVGQRRRLSDCGRGKAFRAVLASSCKEKMSARSQSSSHEEKRALASRYLQPV